MLQNKISYGYYFNDYCGGHSPLLDAERFLVYEAKARRFLQSICSKKVPDENVEDAFACICALAEELYLRQNSGIKSESIDGYSVTFRDDRNAPKGLYNIANMYLGQSDILYAGVE